MPALSPRRSRPKARCQQVLFNNESGLFSFGKDMWCREAMSASASPPSAAAASRNLAYALRD